MRPSSGVMQRRRVLVVDDEASVRAALHQVFVAEQCGVLEAENGREALDLAEHHGVDGVVLDLEMPGMDGYAFLRAELDRPARPDAPAEHRGALAPIVLLTERPVDDARLDPRARAWIVATFAKPADPHLVARTLVDRIAGPFSDAPGLLPLKV